MTAVSVELQGWAWRRWWGLVALVFIVQLALIFWLGEVSLIHPRPQAPAFTLQLAGPMSPELLALRDPTRFVLPHAESFPALWQTNPPPPQFQAFAWPEATRHLLPPADQSAAAFNRFVQTSDFSLSLPQANPEPRLAVPNLPPLAITASRSSLRLEGGLANRRLITPLHPPSWTNSTILADSVVRVVVDATGTPVSWTLLSSSGLPDADQFAVNEAKTARFEPLSPQPGGAVPDAAAQLSWGRMVFRWHTVPPPPATAPAPSP
jgi:hypothetical protein